MQLLGGDAAAGARGLRTLDRCTRAGNDELARRVDIREHEVAVLQELLDGLAVRKDRGHRAGVVARLLLDEATPRLREGEQRSFVEDARGGERDELAVAVARDRVRVHAERAQ